MSDRHEKWTPVEPGHVIPAGQPYRVEAKHKIRSGNTAAECLRDADTTVPETTKSVDAYFVDSSWKPPLVLPTEPTWGVLVHEDPRNGQVTVGEFHLSSIGFFGGKDAKNVLDFIPLTDEQVARIEAAR